MQASCACRVLCGPGFLCASGAGLPWKWGSVSVESLVCAGPCVSVQSLSTGVCYVCVGVPVGAEAWSGEASRCAVGLLYAWGTPLVCRVPDTCGRRSVRGWGCPGVVGGTLRSQAPRPCPAQGSAPPSRSHLLHLPPQLVAKARSTAPRVGLARFLATSRNFRVTPTSGARVKGQA